MSVGNEGKDSERKGCGLFGRSGAIGRARARAKAVLEGRQEKEEGGGRRVGGKGWGRSRLAMEGA